MGKYVQDILPFMACKGHTLNIKGDMQLCAHKGWYTASNENEKSSE